MLKKKEICNQFIISNNIFTCPICHETLTARASFLLCENNHTFNINKKGIAFLVASSKYKQSLIYNSSLFTNRRKFLNDGFYRLIYEYISNDINLNYKNIIILDIGCGEGTHSKMIQNNLKIKNKIIGIDYSKDAINLSSDYASNSNFYFVGDINNIPIKEKTIDVIIDFFSPYNTIEINRILKDDGIIYKIVPGDNYLQELRQNLGMGIYEKKEEVFNNINSNFNFEKIKRITSTYDITNEQSINLLNMTPITNGKLTSTTNKITIDILIYTIKKR